jgi:hypothetical protein
VRFCRWHRFDSWESVHESRERCVRKPFSVLLSRALLPTNFGIERLVHVTESCRAHNKFHLVFVPKKKGTWSSLTLKSYRKG